MKLGILIFGILNAIVGCVAAIILVGLTNNYIYYIVTAITGATSGICFAYSGGKD